MRYLSVCSGIEAATVAWHPLGWTPAGFAEIEPFPRAVLEQRHGAVAVDWDHCWSEGQNFAPLFGDFTQIEASHVGPIDLLVGGTPCQAFSVAGKRLGLDDPRGNLTIEFFRLAKRLGARWVVWENVPGVLSNWSGEPDDDTITGWEETNDFAAILALFHECGYRGGWRVLDAQYVRVDGFGRAVPQRRRRVFLVGHLGNDARALPVLFDPESLRGLDKPRRKAGQGASAASGSDPERDCRSGPGSGLIGGTVSAKWAKGSGGPSGDECQNLVAVEVAPTLQAGGNLTGGHRPPGSTVDTVETLVGVRTSMLAGAVEVSDTLSVGANQTTGKETELVAVPFDTTHITSPANGSNPQPGDPCHTLTVGAHVPSVAYAIQERAVSENPNAGPQGKGWQEDISFTLEARHNVQAVAFTIKDHGQDAGDEVSPTLRSMTHGDSHANGGGQVAVAFQARIARNGRGQPEEICPTLNGADAGATSDMRPMAAIPTVDGWAVRKLTPRECERLQGFPDDFTAIRWRGKEAADGPRYKAIGNSMAVNVMRWIGARIALVEEAVKAAGGAHE